ncbi:adenylyltransferase/cytidyltransferase family protein [bacterium]|nr:adenylyltransferase/cytidyltransferase family protein [bacterium]
MLLVRHLARTEPVTRPRVVAVGRFDGVHRGHQRVLGRLAALARARRAEAVVALRYAPERGRALTTLRQRVALLREWGVDWGVLLGRDDPADDAAVAARLGAAALVTGGELTGPGVDVERVELALNGALPLTAANIREWLIGGDLPAVERALGRPHAVEGPVIHGFHRGARLGIPTANLRVQHLVLPPDGVYAVRAVHRGVRRDGVANIGLNPTFGNVARSVETHLFEFSGDLYGERLEVSFVARLRGEQKFAGIEALVAQIRADMAAARDLLATHGNGH